MLICYLTMQALSIILNSHYMLPVNMLFNYASFVHYLNSHSMLPVCASFVHYFK